MGNEQRIKEIEYSIADLQKELEALKAEKEFKLAETGWVYWAEGEVTQANAGTTWATEAKLGTVMPTKELAEFHGKLHQINGRLLQARHFLCPDWEWDRMELVYEICASNKYGIHTPPINIPSISSVVFPDLQTAEKALEISGVRGLV